MLVKQVYSRQKKTITNILKPRIIFNYSHIHKKIGINKSIITHKLKIYLFLDV